jgi:tryptophan synthase alpha chain
MSRYSDMFDRCRTEHRGAFIPFVVVGDPDMDTSIRVMETLAAAGADALELGIPFSDPVADGPVIQAAAVRALHAGATPDRCFAAIAAIRRQFPALPIGVLTYTNAVMHGGMDAYFARAQSAGVDSVLSADMPVAEADDYIAAARVAAIEPVFIAPPDVDDDTLRAIAAATSGYTYVVTRRGVTGSDDRVSMEFQTILTALKRHSAPPPVMGFGISTPDHVRAVIAAGAAGAISGSAVVRIVERGTAEMMDTLAAFVKEMKQATIHSQA